MAVHLHESLEKVPGWREMADYANTSMPDYLEGYGIYIRPASEIEERRFVKDGEGSTAQFAFDEESGRFDLVFSLAGQWSYEQLQSLFESTKIAVSDETLMGMWMAQGNISDPVAFAEANILTLDPDMFGIDEEDDLD